MKFKKHRKIERDQQEISDVVLEVVEKTEDLDPELEIEKEIQRHIILEREEKGLDYSKLHYGKIAKPLEVKYDYNDEQQPEKTEINSDGTINIEEVDKIIEEKAFDNMLHTGITRISVDAQERFKYWKLFNAGLKEMKYEWAFT